MADRFIVETTIAKVGGNGKMFRRRKEAPQRRVTVSGLHDEGMLARANKIKAMFGVQLKEQATLPGISREKTGELRELCPLLKGATIALMLARLTFRHGSFHVCFYAVISWTLRREFLSVHCVSLGGKVNLITREGREE